MIRRSLTTASALAALLLVTAPGLASAQAGPAKQQPTTTNAAADGLAVKSLRELDDKNLSANWQGLSVEQLEDMDIVGADGKTIGEVEEVLADATGTVVAVTAEVGGFLGIGDREVVVSVEHLQPQGDRLATQLTAEQLEALPRWDDD